MGGCGHSIFFFFFFFFFFIPPPPPPPPPSLPCAVIFSACRLSYAFTISDSQTLKPDSWRLITTHVRFSPFVSFFSIMLLPPHVSFALFDQSSFLVFRDPLSASPVFVRSSIGFRGSRLSPLRSMPSAPLPSLLPLFWISLA